ncbi:Sb-PDE family phosphodiesterase [Opitutus terrae]|uniref:PHP domain protein n=1 Tax=Opitutus terrae (strain DSM 11246 / JCM 15787 / PB90-1) TaxID=452637 RepID=B1ZQV0_OPITP|nr:Sb-PDE family phosphodiesterase [Opitutus terrae]ACB77848.1 PHP domain protein [Opitutus terrae PB90-1]
MIAIPSRGLQRIVLYTAALGLVAAGAGAHPATDSRRIEFPNVGNYQTLVCDFHQHTVFSDGSVWPNIRVQEAERDGLDAIAVTDHLEYQPHASDIPHPDRNRGFVIATEAAAKTKVLVLRGAEVTRAMPPGHCNAIFLQDVNGLLVEDPLAAFREAARQGAFVFWNHPSWIKQTPDGVARLTPLHEQLLNEGLIQGIEVMNEHEFSDESLQLALDRNLTIMGNSDIHGLIDWAHDVPAGGHRPVTLVFAQERSEAALKEALLARRTAVWFTNTLVGRAEWLDPLLAASLQLTSSRYLPDTSVLELVITNRSDADFILRNASSYRLHLHADVLEAKAHQQLKILVKPIQRSPRVVVAFEVLNAVTAPGVHPTIAFAAEVPELTTPAAN